MQRVKSRGDLTSNTATKQVTNLPDGSVGPVEPFYGWTCYPTRESITYDNGRNRENPCSHVKYVMYPTDGRKRTYTTPTQIVTFENDHRFRFALKGPDHCPAMSAPENGWTQFMFRAIQSVRPKFKADVSIPNFLFELKDLKRILPTKRQIEELSVALGKIGSSNPFKRGDAVANAASQQFLSANFGYLPLISDIFKITDAIKNFNSYVDRFKLASGRPLTGYYTEINSNRVKTVVDSYDDGTIKSRLERQEGQIKYNCTIKYSYDISLPHLFAPSLLLKYAGFRSNPRIIWDAIPFSFLLDWVYKFGKALESFDDGAVPCNMYISSITFSIDGSVVEKSYISDSDPDALSSYNVGIDALDATEGWEVYERWVSPMLVTDFLETPPLPVSDGLSVKEILLGAALGKTLTKGR